MRDGRNGWRRDAAWDNGKEKTVGAKTPLLTASLTVETAGSAGEIKQRLVANFLMQVDLTPFC